MRVADLIPKIDFDDAYAMIRLTTQRDIREAERQGLLHTPYREFLPYEHVGAFKCGGTIGKTKLRRCGNRATVVSYGVRFPGRTSLCSRCFSRMKSQK